MLCSHYTQAKVHPVSILKSILTDQVPSLFSVSFLLQVYRVQFRVQELLLANMQDLAVIFLDQFQSGHRQIVDHFLLTSFCFVIYFLISNFNTI